MMTENRLRDHLSFSPNFQTIQSNIIVKTHTLLTMSSDYLKWYFHLLFSLFILLPHDWPNSCKTGSKNCLTNILSKALTFVDVRTIGYALTFESSVVTFWFYADLQIMLIFGSHLLLELFRTKLRTGRFEARKFK